MGGLPRFALRRTSLVLAGLVLALFWSLAAFGSMQRREDPGTTQRQTTVVTVWPGATTGDVEQLVTKKIADDLRSVAHVQHVEGTSRPGISQVDVVFDDVVNDAAPVLRDVRNHLSDLTGTLPPGIDGPSLVDDVWKTYPLVLGVVRDGASPRELRDVAKRLGDAISRLPDVGVVHLVGAREQQVRVDLDVAALGAYGIAPRDVTGAIAGHNALVPAGTVDAGGRRAQVDPSTPLRDAGDVAAVAVAAPGGRIVRVGDLARVTTGYPDPPDELVRADGAPAVALAIGAKETASLTDLGPEVDALLARERDGWPAGTRIVRIADQIRTVDERLADFGLNLVLAVAIVTALVALFMGWRNGLLVGVTVVLSIALTLGYVRLIAVDLNQISILALIIALGIIVDAGIVCVDNVERHLRAGASRSEAADAGVRELAVPLLTSTLVAISSFLPFRLMGGSVGDFVRDLGVVTSVSLAMSLIVAYLITPILARAFAATPRDATRRTPFDRLLEGLGRLYVPVATAALRHARLTVALATLAVAGAAAWIPHLGVQFFPSADRAQFFIDVNAPDGTDIRSTEAIVAQIEAVVRAQSGVTAVGSFVGAGAPHFYYNVIAQQPKPSYAQVLVDTSTIGDANRLVATLRSRLREEIAGARIEVKKLEQGPPVGAPVQIRLAGDDASELARAARSVRERLAAIPGAIAVRDSLGEPTLALRAHVDTERAAAASVSSTEIARLVALAYGGETASAIREPDRQTPIVVRLPPALRADTNRLGALGVRSANGAVVPLAEVATVRPETQTSLSTMRDGSRIVTVLGDVEARLASAVLADFRATGGASHLPSGVRLTYAGEDEQTTTSFRNLAVAVVVGLLINQMVLLGEFRTLRLSLVVLTAVPLGLVGAVAGLALTGQHFGFIASLGIASLGGIVTNHAIVLFEYARREMEEGTTMERALIDAGTKRLRPILLTVLASIAGLLPLAFSQQTLWQPFCWAVIFGLGGSMVMTLVTIPAIYRISAATAAVRAA